MKIVNWKTTATGLVFVAVYVLDYFFPEHKQFIDGFIPLLLAVGFLSAKDHNVTGGTKEQ